MIESINQAGGAGGGVQSVVAGTGITVDNTDPENPIVNSAGIDTDEKAKVSSNDTTAGYLNGKLVAGSGIAFTENNNGSNETLSIALGSHTHAASDITSGIVATARLGSGTASSSTYLKGDQTYSGIDAGHITAGTVGTARLGSGTANGTTFLAGDQTYKTPPYPVTSVNLQTGAVTVNDEQVYSFTIQDAENTTALRNLISVTVPGGSGAPTNGDIIWIDLLYHTRNLSGSSANLSSGLVINGQSVTTSTNALLNSATNFYGRVRQAFWFDNVTNVIRTVSPGQNAVETNYAGPTYTQNTPTYWSFDSFPTISNPFASFTIQLTAQWNVANANTFVRVLNARAYRQRGQAT